MDQRQLYEQQVLKQKDVSVGRGLGSRETALFEWITTAAAPASRSAQIRIAELSIGDGQLSRAIAGAFPSVLIDCIDISPSRLSHASKLVTADLLIADRLKFLELNLDTQFDRLANENYEIVIAIDVLEHVFDPFEFVRHCFRILKPGGWLFLRVPNVAYLKHRWEILRGALPVTSSYFETPGSYRAWKERHGWDGGHLHFFTIASLRWLLTEEGFDVMGCNDIGARASGVRRLWPGLLYGNLAVSARRRKTNINASAH